jgi:hypothetical protein
VSENITLKLVVFIALPLYTAGWKAKGIIGNGLMRVKLISLRLFAFLG